MKPSQRKVRSVIERPKAWTSAELKKAFELEAEGLGPELIAERLGRTYNSVSSTMSVHRRKPKLFTMEQFAERRRRMVELFEKGVTITELALIYCTKIQVIADCLGKEGLDAEMRQELRSGLSEQYAG